MIYPPKKLHLILVMLAALPFLACSLTSTAARLAPTVQPGVTMRISTYDSPTLTPWPPSTARSTPSPILCQVNTDALHLRSCASVECEPVGWLRAGELVKVLDPGHWALVQVGDQLTGWVNTDYLECER